MRAIFTALILALVFTNSYTVRATHYLGGEVTYRYLGNDKYRFTVRIYQDCHLGDPAAMAQDNPIVFSVFTANGVRYLVDSITSTSTFSLVPGTLSECYNDTNHYCTQYTEFQKTITLPAANNGYIWVNQRCCLTGDITNISSPQNEGLTLSCIIPGPNPQPNSSPSFNTVPTARECINNNFTLDFSATDPDGDALLYLLVDAYKGGTANNAKPIPTSTVFTPLTYQYPYSSQLPFGESGYLTIDSVTGHITGRIATPGVYMIAVACIEGRNGNIINTTTRIYSLTISDCNKTVSASIKKDEAVLLAGLNGVSLVSCGGNRTIQFNNTSKGASNYFWDFGIVGSNDTSTLANPSVTYPAAGKYTVMLVAHDGHCSDTLITSVIISDDDLTTDFTISGGPCLFDTLILSDASASTGSTIVSNIWKVGGQQLNGSPATIQLTSDSSTLITHVVSTAGGCIGAKSKTYTVKRSAIAAMNDTTVVQGTLLMLKASGGSDYKWLAIPPAMFVTNQPTPNQAASTVKTGKGFTYVVVGTDASGCVGRDTVRITVSSQGYAFVPTGFTPNGDGKNDVLLPKLSGCNLVSFTVYNRRGNEVFSTTDIRKGWDGRHNNIEAAAGVYYWMIRANDASGVTTVYKGDVTLLR